MDAAEAKQKLLDDLNELSRKLDSPEEEANAEAEMRERLRPSVDNHHWWIVASRAAARWRVVI